VQRTAAGPAGVFGALHGVDITAVGLDYSVRST
jgi:hypothetical protein